MQDIFTEDLMFVDKKAEAIEFIQKLDVRARLKKEAFIAWVKAVGGDLTAPDVRELLGSDAFRV